MSSFKFRAGSLANAGTRLLDAVAVSAALAVSAMVALCVPAIAQGPLVREAALVLGAQGALRCLRYSKVLYGAVMYSVHSAHGARRDAPIRLSSARLRYC